MILAVLSDIHGNLSSLEAVLEDINRMTHAVEIVILGDIASQGPHPNEVVDLVRSLDAHVVLGNTDLWAAKYRSLEKMPSFQSSNALRMEVEWLQRELSPSNSMYLVDLPFSVLLLGTVSSAFAVHGSPRSFCVSASSLPAEEKKHLSLSSFYDLLLCGHTHIPFYSHETNLIIVNPGSVGMPKDGDKRASYSLVNLHDDGLIDVETRRIDYNVSKCLSELERKNAPAMKWKLEVIDSGIASCPAPWDTSN